MKSPDRFIAALGLSAVVAACSTSAEASPKPTPTSTPRQTHTEVIVGACPPGYVAPWEAQPKPLKSPTSATQIELVSFVKPQPTPDRNPIECFYEVEVEGPAPTQSPIPSSINTQSDSSQS